MSGDRSARHEPTDVLSRLAVELTARQDERVTARVAVAQFLVLLEEAEHVSLTLGTGRSFRTLAGTSDLATDLADAQDRLAEGPCFQNLSPRAWTRSGDVGADERWPHWGPLAADRGVRSVLSVRLMARTRPVGTLAAYTSLPRAFADPAHIERALLYATHASQALVGARTDPLG